MAALIRPRILRYVKTRTDTHPLAQAIAARLSFLIGSDLNGTRGARRIGETSQIGGARVTGYVAAPQNYIGAGRMRQGVDGGAIRAGLKHGGYPNSQAPYSENSPLLAQIAAAQNPKPAPGSKGAKK